MAVLSWINYTGTLTGDVGQEIDGVDITVNTETLSVDSFTAIKDWDQYYVNPTGDDFARDSALKIYSGNVDDNTAGSFFNAERVTINFGDSTDPDNPTVSNVAFRLNNINGDGSNPIDGIIIKAFDEFGNEIEVSAVVGDDVDLDDSGTGVEIKSTDQVLYSRDPDGSALINVDGPVSYVEITYSMDEEVVEGPGDPFIPTFIVMSDVHFDAIGPEVDHHRFPSEPIDAYPDNDHDDILGTPGDDSISTGDDADTISGFGGDDTLDGGIDDDTISGGDGSDSIIGGRGNDTIDGGSGDDTINAGTTPDHFYSDYGDTPGGGTSYDDPKFDPSGIEGWYTDPNQNDDRDFVESRGGDDVIFTGDDADTIYSGDDDDYVDGGIDDDYISGGLGRDTLVGDHGSDTIFGNDGADLIYASSSTLLYPDAVDAVDPFTDNDMDVVDGGTGDDTIYGGDDDDSLHGGTGVDYIYGEIDEDTISGGRHGDHLYGGDGDDLIFGYNHEDTLNGGEGDLSIPLSGDLDHLYGGAGDDTMFGGSQNDTLEGGEGHDVMFGGEDQDWFQDLTEGDYVDGGEAGDDHDTLDFRPLGTIDQGTTAVSDILIDNPDGNGGTIFIDFDASNSEDGEVTYFDAGGSQIGDKLIFTNIENVIIPCFTPGTRIATPKGEVLVEDLEMGDRIITRDNGIQEIRWIGSRDLSSKDLSQKDHLHPVLIRKGALGNGLPERDMKVSPNHRMLVASEKTAFYFEEREVLVAAKHLVDLPGVEFVDVKDVTYIHFMFDQHEVVLSDGAWSESFQPGDYTLQGIDSEQRAEILELFPELAEQEGLEGYQAARRSLKRYEAQLLTQ